MTDAPLEAGPPQQWRAGLSRRRMLNVLAGVAFAGRPGAGSRPMLKASLLSVLWPGSSASVFRCT